jgi:DNA-directed RNA polymerase specialized sigma24 family protein
MDVAAEAEFTDFVRSRWPRLVRLAYGLSGDQGLAEDLAQTALVKAYASWPRVHRAGDPDAYVRRIVVNASRSMFRKRRVAEQLSDTLPEPGQADLP